MISVVIPSYNREKTIERAVRSVLNQTWSDLEVIVVDDCSADKTLEVLASIDDPRLRVYKLEENSGACVARNRGIDEAKGDYIAFQDSDDSWRPDKLAVQIACLEKYEADVVFGQMAIYQGEKCRIMPDLPEGCIDYDTLLKRSVVSTQTILAKKGIFEKIRFDPVVRRLQDFDWVVRAAGQAVVAFSKTVVADVYVQSDSISMSSLKVKLENNKYLLEKYSEICREHPLLEINLLKRQVMHKRGLHMNPSAEYKRLYELGKNKKFLMLSLLSDLHLMGLVDKVKGVRGES